MDHQTIWFPDLQLRWWGLMSIESWYKSLLNDDDSSEGLQWYGYNDDIINVIYQIPLSWNHLRWLKSSTRGCADQIVELSSIDWSNGYPSQWNRLDALNFIVHRTDIDSSLINSMFLITNNWGSIQAAVDTGAHAILERTFHLAIVAFLVINSWKQKLIAASASQHRYDHWQSYLPQAVWAIISFIHNLKSMFWADVSFITTSKAFFELA